MRDPSPPLYLTEGLRETFKENIGELIVDSEIEHLFNHLKDSLYPIATIGDTTTLNIINGGVIPDLCIVDLKTRRGKLNSQERSQIETLLRSGEVTEIINPPEIITKELWIAIKSFYNKFKIGKPGRMGTTPLIIKIIGEEDLATPACIYFSQDGGHVLYGLPDKGMVHIQVNDERRRLAYDALIKMEA